MKISKLKKKRKKKNLPKYVFEVHTHRQNDKHAYLTMCTCPLTYIQKITFLLNQPNTKKHKKNPKNKYDQLYHGYINMHQINIIKIKQNTCE